MTPDSIDWPAIYKAYKASGLTKPDFYENEIPHLGTVKQLLDQLCLRQKASDNVVPFAELTYRFQSDAFHHFV